MYRHALNENFVLLQQAVGGSARYRFLGECHRAPWRPKGQRGRSFTNKQWRFVQDELTQLDVSSTNERLKVALHLLYANGLRLSEVVAARTTDLRNVEYPGDREDELPLAGWVLRVVGKGHKEREVPVPDGVVSELMSYLKGRGVRADDEATGARTC